MAKPKPAANDPPQTRDFQKIGPPIHSTWVEFEPQNLGLISTNSNGEIVEGNEAFLSMSGYSPADLPLALAAIMPAQRKTLDDGKFRHNEDEAHYLPWQSQIRTRQGHVLPVLIGAAAIRPTENRFQYFIVNLENHLQANIAISDYQSRLRNAAFELSLSGERERRSIAGEIHDNIGQELAIAKLRLSKLRAETSGKIRAELDEIAAQIANSLVSCRRLSHDLATPALYKLGLVPAIKNLIAALNRDQQLCVSLNCDNEEVPLPNNTRIILYRVIRELLINVLKHAQASNVAILVTREDHAIKVVITDDGIGCDAHDASTDSGPERGLGLFLVRERLLHIGGSFAWESAAGKGTKATMVAPLNEMANAAESVR